MNTLSAVSPWLDHGVQLYNFHKYGSPQPFRLRDDGSFVFASAARQSTLVYRIRTLLTGSSRRPWLLMKTERLRHP